MGKKTIGSGAVLLLLLLLAAAVAGREEPAQGEGAPARVVRIGEMSSARAAHQATVLQGGEVLVTGGCPDPGCEEVLASAELYDPASRTFRAVGSMTTPRSAHAAALLPDGRVLVTGGWTGRHTTAGAEVFDPASGRFTPVGEMVEARLSHSAVPLPDGRVLLCCSPESRETFAEVFDPATSTFSAVATSRVPSAGSVAVALADGRVLVTGGRHHGRALRSAEIYHPATGELRPTGDMAVPRHKHAAVRLADGRVLVLAGEGREDRQAATELYDPAAGSFSPGPALRSPRRKIRDAVVVLPSGAVLVAGGSARPELWDPAGREFVPLRGELEGLHEFATATLLPTGEVLVLGGYDDRIRPSASAWLARAGR
ncbi:MAG TPA: kelch repeat-containing protein [Longimicrobiaceae bacterium]|nr:kelch repeat-containing protein [Longimicrobiaceae bacterium]